MVTHTELLGFSSQGLAPGSFLGVDTVCTRIPVDGIRKLFREPGRKLLVVPEAGILLT